MGSYSFTCYQTEALFTPQAYPKLMFDLSIPEGWKAELTWGSWCEYSAKGFFFSIWTESSDRFSNPGNFVLPIRLLTFSRGRESAGCSNYKSAVFWPLHQNATTRAIKLRTRTRRDEVGNRFMVNGVSDCRITWHAWMIYSEDYKVSIFCGKQPWRLTDSFGKQGSRCFSKQVSESSDWIVDRGHSAL